MILLLVLLSLAGSLARPQDVEFVTSLETAQDETITDNPIVGLELGASKGNKHTNTNWDYFYNSFNEFKLVEEFIMLDDDLADGTDGSDGSTDRIPESLDTQEEDVTVLNDVIVDLNENIIADLEPSYVVKEEKILTLEITDYPEQSISFRSSSGPLGLNCDAHSLVDNDIKFMWTKNGRFIDTTAGHVIFEYQTNGRPLKHLFMDTDIHST